MTTYASIKTDGNEPPPPATWIRMFIIGMIVVSPSFLTGMSISYTTIALPQMNLNLDEVTWFGSVGAIAAPIGSLLVGLIIDRFGRKSALLFGIAPSVFGWFFLCSELNLPVILLGQFLHGLTPGAVGYPSQVYVGECVMMSSVWLRNSCMMWIGLLMSAGITFLLVLGIFLYYKLLCGIATVISVAVGAIFWYAIPESPTWLYRRGRIGDAEWAEKKLGICQPILRQGNRETTPPSMETTSPVQWSSIKNVLARIRRKDVYKPLIISVVLAVATPLGGPTPVLVYMISILNNVSPGVSVIDTSTAVTSSGANIPQPFNSTHALQNAFGDLVRSAGNVPSTSAGPTQPSDPIEAYVSGAISGGLMMAATFVASGLVPYVGVKKCLISSQLGVAIGMALLTYTDANGIEPNLPQVHTLAVWVVIFGFGIITSANMSLFGDLFPTSAKGYASVSMTLSGLCAFVVIKLHPYIYLAISWYLYCAYALVSIFSAVFIHFCVPEVAGKTLEEINEEFLIDDN